MYNQIASNKRKSIALFVGFFVLYILIGLGLYAAFGPIGFVVVFVIAIGMSLTALFGGDDLAVKVAGGVQVHSKEEAPELWRMLENLAITAGLPMPRLYISPDPSANAFAAGRSPEQAIVCVNQGLLNTVDDLELQGVLAHEMSHVRNYDVRLMTYAAVLAGSIALIAQLASYGLWFGGTNNNDDEGGDNGWIGLVIVLLTIILAPIAATIIQLAISRKREYVADASGVELTRYPAGLASALNAISGNEDPPLRDESSIAHMMIAPQLNVSGNPSKLFSTHPPTEDRIARLMEMAGGVAHNRGVAVATIWTTPFSSPQAQQAPPPPQQLRSPFGL